MQNACTELAARVAHAGQKGRCKVQTCLRNGDVKALLGVEPGADSGASLRQLVQPRQRSLHPRYPVLYLRQRRGQ